VDYEDAQFTAAGLVLTLAGTVAAVLAAAGVATGASAAAVLVPPAILLLVSGHALAPTRRWSIRLAQAACPVAGGVWVIVLLVDGTGASTATFAAMAGASVWASHFLADALRPPAWTITAARSPLSAIDAAGWIEELPPDGVGGNR
jgi:hypothetical protein